MDVYTLGKLALPVMVGIMGVAAVERLFHQLEESRKSSLTINIHPGKRPFQPPMQEHE
jgi:hypothetical protein